MDKKKGFTEGNMKKIKECERTTTGKHLFELIPVNRVRGEDVVVGRSWDFIFRENVYETETKTIYMPVCSYCEVIDTRKKPIVKIEVDRWKDSDGSLDFYEK